MSQKDQKTLLLDRWFRKRYEFPRDIGFEENGRIWREKCSSCDEFISRRPIFSNVFSDWMKKNDMYDTLFFDIDCHNETLDEGITKVLKVIDILDDYKLRLYFTGRGFHIYLDYPLVKIDYRRTARWFVDDKGIERYVDLNVVGDKNRIMRLVDTKRSFGMYVIEVDYDIVTDECRLIEAAVGREHFIEFDDTMNDWIVDEFKKLKFDFERRTSDVKVDIFDLPPCVERGIEMLIEVGELSHLWRFHIAAYLVNVVGNERLARDVFKFANDYDERITDYQISHIRDNGYRPLSCRRCMELGICKKKCPFYDLYDGWLGGR